MLQDYSFFFFHYSAYFITVRINQSAVTTGEKQVFSFVLHKFSFSEAFSDFYGGFLLFILFLSFHTELLS